MYLFPYTRVSLYMYVHTHTLTVPVSYEIKFSDNNQSHMTLMVFLLLFSRLCVRSHEHREILLILQQQRQL